MDRKITINVCLNSEKDGKLLEDLLALLSHHGVKDSSSVLEANVVQQSTSASTTSSADSDEEVMSAETTPTGDSVAVYMSQGSPYSREGEREGDEEIVPDVSISYQAAEIRPEAYLNESELSLLPTRRAARQSSIVRTRRSPADNSQLAADFARVSAVVSPLKSRLTSLPSQEKRPASECWLKKTSNTAIQEWLAKKDKEQRRRMRQEAKEKREVEKKAHQRENQANERAKLAQDSYRAWLAAKEPRRETSFSSTLQDSTFSIQGIRSPTPVKVALNPARLRRLKRSITYKEWTETKNLFLSKSSQRPRKPHPPVSKEPVVKKHITYSEWLASKDKRRHGQKRNSKAEKVSEELQTLHPGKQLRKRQISSSKRHVSAGTKMINQSVENTV